jgi:phospholipase C
MRRFVWAKLVLVPFCLVAFQGIPATGQTDHQLQSFGSKSPGALDAATLPLSSRPNLEQAREVPSAPVSSKIQHIFIIMQENRSFDHYFGTYPGANGIPVNANGVPTVCQNDPLTGVCLRPYHSSSLVNFGGPHSNLASAQDIDQGKMDGYVASAENGKKNCINSEAPACRGSFPRCDELSHWA